MAAPAKSPARKRAETMVIRVFDELDRSGKNSERLRKFFDSMDEKSFMRWAREFAADPEDFFTLEVLPWGEPGIPDIERAAAVIGVPLDERVTFPHLGGQTTLEPVPVG